MRFDRLAIPSRPFCRSSLQFLVHMNLAYRAVLVTHLACSSGMPTGLANYWTEQGNFLLDQRRSNRWTKLLAAAGLSPHWALEEESCPSVSKGTLEQRRTLKLEVLGRSVAGSVNFPGAPFGELVEDVRKPGPKSEATNGHHQHHRLQQSAAAGSAYPAKQFDQ